MPLDPSVYERFVRVLGRVNIDEKIIRRGFGHLSASEKSHLLGGDPIASKIAEGILYENCVYEVIVDLVEYDQDFTAVLGKRRRMVGPKTARPGTVGIRYNHGDIHIKCDGADFAELDSMLLDSGGNFCVIESKKGLANPEGLLRDYSSRQMLLKKLTGKEVTPYILICSEDVSNRRLVKELVSQPYAYFVHVGFDAYAAWRSDHGPAPVKVELPRRSKVRGTAAFPLIPVNYRPIYEEIRARAYDSLRGGQLDPARFRDYDFPTKVVLGRVSTAALVRRLEDLKFSVRESLQDYRPSVLGDMGFEYAILAFELGEMQGSLYLKRANERRFIKFGPRLPHVIGIDREIDWEAGRFYRDLLKERKVLDDGIVTNYLESFFRDSPGRRRRRGARPTMGSLLEHAAAEPGP